MPRETCTCADGILFGHLFVLGALLVMLLVPRLYGAWCERRASCRIAQVGEP